MCFRNLPTEKMLDSVLVSACEQNVNGVPIKTYKDRNSTGESAPGTHQRQTEERWFSETTGRIRSMVADTDPSCAWDLKGFAPKLNRSLYPTQIEEYAG